MHCDLPTIAHMCGSETANLVVNLTRKSFGSMQTMAIDTGAISRWPSVCKDIRTYKLPTVEDSMRFVVPKNATMSSHLIDTGELLTSKTGVSLSPFISLSLLVLKLACLR
ncbi:hypothetical protein AB6A40_001564 [Gnathostoma spinigerum]|uniref:Uncharacterized protein n=1 Tax=Gnathostoma spinigerum TaxID=75299 RepID=A0ABD6E4G7_9BILA